MYRAFKSALMGALMSLATTQVNAQAEHVDGVMILNDFNFWDTINSNDYLLIYFYKEKCEPCQMMAGDFKRAAKKLEEMDPPRQIAKYNLHTAPKRIREKFNITGFPSFAFFDHGKHMEEVDCKECRGESGIIKTMKENSNLPLVPSITCERMQFQMNNAELSVGYIGKYDGELYDALHKASDRDDVGRFNFYQTDDESCVKHFPGLKAPGIVYGRQWVDTPMVFEGESSALVGWMKKHSHPAIFEFKLMYRELIFKEGHAALFLISNLQDTQYHKTFAKAAEKLGKRILFVTSGITDDFQKPIVTQSFGVKRDDVPLLMLIVNDEENDRGLMKYKWDGDLSSMTIDDVETFIDDWEADNVTPILKSQEPPAEQEGPVHVLVGKNHDQFVLDETKDVLVEYYADWCGHCKALAPHYEQLAKEVEGIEDLVIAKMLGTDNETSMLHVSGYPTLNFYPKNGGQPTRVMGRDYDSIKLWLNQNSEAYKAATTKSEL